MSSEEGTTARVLPLFMESRKAGVLIRLENGDVGNSDVEVRSLYSPPNAGVV